MARKGRMFAGCTVALVTPFRDGAVDEAALRSLVDWHVAEGTPTLSPVGTTGESPTLTHDEHERSHRPGGRVGRWSSPRHGRHGVELDGRSNQADAVRRTCRRRRGLAGSPLLQSPQSGRNVPPFRGNRGERGPSRWSSTTFRVGPVAISSQRQLNVYRSLVL